MLRMALPEAGPTPPPAWEGGAGSSWGAVVTEGQTKDYGVKKRPDIHNFLLYFRLPDLFKTLALLPIDVTLMYPLVPGTNT